MRSCTSQLNRQPVVLRPRESTDVAVANLAGFVLELSEKGKEGEAGICLLCRPLPGQRFAPVFWCWYSLCGRPGKGSRRAAVWLRGQRLRVQSLQSCFADAVAFARRGISCCSRWDGWQLTAPILLLESFGTSHVRWPHTSLLAWNIRLGKPVVPPRTCCISGLRHSSIGTSLLPPAEHALADWEGTVAQRSQQKLEKLAEEIAKLEAWAGIKLVSPRTSCRVSLCGW